MLGATATDVSEFQVPVTNAYPHGWLIFRACDGTYQDRVASKNLAWAKTAAASGRIAGYTAYCVFRPGADTFGTITDVIGQPDQHVTVMIDVESWGGAIRGNYSPQITKLADQLATWLGDRRRVIAYGNQNDLATIYPNRPDWIRLVVASYGSIKPAVRNMIGWQYSDGQKRYPVPVGMPRSTKPFGPCDHNIFPGLTPLELAATLGVGDDMPLTDVEIQKIADAVWSKALINPDDPKKIAYTAGTWLVYSNLKAGKALTAAVDAGKSAAVDAAAVAADITSRVRANLAALFGGPQ